MKRIILFMMMVLLFCSGKVQAEEGMQPEQLVRKEVECLATGDVVKYSRLWTRGMENEIFLFHGSRIKGYPTIFNIEEAALKNVKELPISVSHHYLPHLSKYLSYFGNDGVKTLYIAVEYKVKKENPYQLNGINYFLQVLVKENGSWHIAESGIAPTDQLFASGHGFQTKDEKQYMKRRKELRKKTP
ncbi:hypothetical protein [Bacillus sp. 165]|uniref:hypothetical protein n=1 Tax=Bacillus sp. 165 TaxID=1529117 RepID=UPI001ADA2029|nr:hypothetical protein [Bacillus sp. 165]MBO9129814.1 hypothetical protein [Bacillus sp. 165]